MSSPAAVSCTGLQHRGTTLSLDLEHLQKPKFLMKMKLKCQTHGMIVLKSYLGPLLWAPDLRHARERKPILRF